MQLRINSVRPCMLIAAFVLCLARVSAGWSEVGHKVTGLIAAEYLTPTAAAAAHDLLDGQSLADVSTWADKIKGDRTYRWANVLHYANVDPNADGFEYERDCPGRKCVVAAIVDYAEIVRDRSAPREKRAEALRFLIHFVGDVHQPLHMGNAHDKGGNDIAVSFFRNRTNLHRLWDSGIIRRAKHQPQPYAEKLLATITPEKITQWSTLDPVVWGNESLHLARDVAYKVPPDGELADEYFNKAIAVTDLQLARGGVRLAAMLNDVLGEEAGSTTQPTAPSQPASTQPAE